METTTLIFLFILVWGILGVTFLCIGIGLHVRGRKKRNTCTLPVTATVVDLRRKMENGHETPVYTLSYHQAGSMQRHLIPVHTAD